MKKLSELIIGISDATLIGNKDAVISRLITDSRKIKEGDLFFAVRGAHSDGHAHIAEALSKGASAIVYDREIELPKNITAVRVKDSYQDLAPISKVFYDAPASRMKMIGITGTNGKTTTAFLLRSILETSGIKTSLLGTVGYLIGNKTIDAPNTTPDALLLNSLLSESLEAGIDSVVMEVSSHALKLGRVSEMKFECGIFTNLTQDHLDFHSDMEDYFESKLKLFELSNGKGAVNLDDRYGLRIQSLFSNVISFGENGSVTAKNIDYKIDGTKFDLIMPGFSKRISTRLVGRPNVWNCLASAAGAISVGIEMNDIVAGLESADAPPGRFELVPTNERFAIAVDYAHTPDALERLLQTGRELKPRRLHLLFGCGGDRDRKKRPIMGEIAERLADKVWITSDNPRTEAPEKIIDEIMPGAGSKSHRICDRREAIFKAVSELQEGDILLVAGKGHETYQIIGTEKNHFDDREVVRDAVIMREEKKRNRSN